MGTTIPKIDFKVETVEYKNLSLTVQKDTEVIHGGRRRNIPVEIQRQVLVIQKAQRTVDVPLPQYIDTTVDVPVAKTLQKTA